MQTMPSAGLITGASSGIGLELARIHASKGNNVVLVARRKELLEQIQKELIAQYAVKVVIFTIDLTQPDAPELVYAFTKSQGLFIDCLFNNAGFGGSDQFSSRPIAKDKEMIQLNITALIALTHIYLPDMIQQNRGKILNTSSTAGFLPGPYHATYFATKAFVNSFSQAISYELRNTKISVTALCPGPVKTEFAKVAGLEGNEMFENGASSYSTALKGYNGMMRGKRIIISSFWLNMATQLIMPFTPTILLLKAITKGHSV